MYDHYGLDECFGCVSEQVAVMCSCVVTHLGGCANRSCGPCFCAWLQLECSLVFRLAFGQVAPSPCPRTTFCQVAGLYACRESSFVMRVVVAAAVVQEGVWRLPLFDDGWCCWSRVDSVG